MKNTVIIASCSKTQSFKLEFVVQCEHAVNLKLSWKLRYYLFNQFIV